MTYLLYLKYILWTYVISSLLPRLSSKSLSNLFNKKTIIFSKNHKCMSKNTFFNKLYMIILWHRFSKVTPTLCSWSYFKNNCRSFTNGTVRYLIRNRYNHLNFHKIFSVSVMVSGTNFYRTFSLMALPMFHYCFLPNYTSERLVGVVYNALLGFFRQTTIFIN